ncbi:hypothetical protein EAY24_25060 [Vibrio anguillarum]|nr:hypothetical protein [Vibrio anguillarum]
MFSFDQTQLQQIGYNFEVLAECVYQVTWDDVVRIMTCVDPDEQQRQNDNPMDSMLPINI